MGICLNMIVKNEAHIIERCLRSVLPILDHWCIVDTGSTDGTQTKIRNFFDGIVPGELIERPWVNFGHNRTEAFELARPHGEWVLLVDADMVLHRDGFRAEDLDLGVSGYRVWQGTESFGYENVRLLRSDLPWRCVGVTHEYFTTGLEHEAQETLRTLRIQDIGDGGSKLDKFERDIRLLREGLTQEPHNTRYVFYLAQSYRDIGDYREALGLYRQRAQMGDFEEEAWYAAYQTGVCLEALGEHQEAIVAYLSAYDRRPTRAEPLHACAVLARKLGRWGLAVLCSRGAMMLPRPNDILFVSEDVYAWRALDEFVTASYWAGQPHEGRIALMRLLSLPLPPWERERIEKNASFFR